MKRWTCRLCFLVAIAHGRPALTQGDGTFHFPLQIAVPNPAVGIASGDFNRDGKLDLAVAHGVSRVSILLQDPTERERWGGTAPLEVGTATFFLRAADFDGDGDDDLAVADPGSFGYIVACRGDGGCNPPKKLQSASNGPRGVVVRDFDGDGDLDLAFANRLGGDLTVFFGEGDGSFLVWKNFPARGQPHSIESVDLDDDGRPDLLAGVDSPGVIYLLNLGSGDFRMVGIL